MPVGIFCWKWGVKQLPKKCDATDLNRCASQVLSPWFFFKPPFCLGQILWRHTGRGEIGGRRTGLGALHTKLQWNMERCRRVSPQQPSHIADVPLIVLWVFLHRGVIRCFYLPQEYKKIGKRAASNTVTGGALLSKVRWNRSKKGTFQKSG